MSRGFMNMGHVEAEWRYDLDGNDVEADATIGVRQCWFESGSYVELSIKRPDGGDKLLLIDIGFEEARKLGALLTESTRTADPTDNGMIEVHGELHHPWCAWLQTKGLVGRDRYPCDCGDSEECRKRRAENWGDEEPHVK